MRALFFISIIVFGIGTCGCFLCFGAGDEAQYNYDEHDKRCIGTAICCALIPLTPLLISIWGLVSARTQVERLDALASSSSEQDVSAYSSSVLDQGDDLDKIMLCLDELTMKNLGKSELEIELVDEWRTKFYAISLVNTAQLILTVLLYLSAILSALCLKFISEGEGTKSRA